MHRHIFGDTENDSNAKEKVCILNNLVFIYSFDYVSSVIRQ
jgi:hypothetical protein